MVETPIRRASPTGPGSWNQKAMATRIDPKAVMVAAPSRRFCGVGRLEPIRRTTAPMAPTNPPQVAERARETGFWVLDAAPREAFLRVLVALDVDAREDVDFLLRELVDVCFFLPWVVAPVFLRDRDGEAPRVAMFWTLPKW